tara:strand:- start:159 stop:620 length:462 start_codon:yes stop_codon:yes gene_type:complete
MLRLTMLIVMLVVVFFFVVPFINFLSCWFITFALFFVLDLVGAFNAAMMMKPMDDSMDAPERARRGAHGPACVNVFSNRLCAEFVGGSRQRRKGHGGSQVCQAIVASARMQAQAAILFSDETVSKFEIAFAEEDSELGARCDADFGGTCAAIK